MHSRAAAARTSLAAAGLHPAALTRRGQAINELRPPPAGTSRPKSAPGQNPWHISQFTNPFRQVDGNSTRYARGGCLTVQSRCRMLTCTCGGSTCVLTPRRPRRSRNR